MCLRPVPMNIDGPLPGKKINRPCGKCWACLKNKTNDLVGRGLGEAAHSDRMLMLNLTYGDDRIESDAQKNMIVKKDFTHFMMRLRRRMDLDDKKAGRSSGISKCRYLAAGEYGSRKGRAHFHCLCFIKGEFPDIVLNEQKQYFEPWPWGFTYAEEASGERAVRYVAKYLLKSKSGIVRDALPSEEWVTYSRQPLLGAPFFVALAVRQAEMRTMPYTLNYLPPGADPKNKFSMYGSAQEVFFDTLLHLWPEARNAPRTEWVDNAWRRYLRVKAQKAWDAMPREERAEYELQLNVRNSPEPSRAAKMRKAWIDYDRREEWLDRKKAALARGEEWDPLGPELRKLLQDL